MKKSLKDKILREIEGDISNNKELQDPEHFRSLGLPIKIEDAERRVDEFLGTCYPFLSREKWKRRINENQVHVNCRPVRRTYKLRLGDNITYYRPESEEPEVNKNIKVIWEKDGIIGVYKPSNLPMHEGGMFRKNTFAEVLKNTLGPEWAAVHRLDRETSGVVLCADDKDLRNDLSAKLRLRNMEKYYLAIGRGVPEEQSWHVDAPIGEAKKTIFRTKRWVEDDGLPSLTYFDVLESTKTHSLMRVFPKTGRTHQIRVHSAWKGFPLVGEKKYYPDETVYLEYLENGLTDRVLCLTEADRLCLHAKSLRFEHPRTKEDCFIEVDMPDDMKEIWDRLKSNDLIN